MSKSARRRRGIKAQPFGQKITHVTLQNPVSQHFASFVLGNALTWETMAHDRLLRDNHEAAQSLEPFGGLLEMYESEFKDPSKAEKWRLFRGMVTEHCAEQFVVTEGSAVGQTLVICGAGPSLNDTAAEYCPKGDQVWGCNSAATYLYDRGLKVTHGFTVDQTPHMLTEWYTAPDIDYMLASTCHTHLVDMLKAKGRRLQFFHNYVGIRGDDVEWPDENGQSQKMMYEDWLYAVLYPATVRAGSGLNAVTRAIDVGCYMGFDKIYVLGADCALKVMEPCPTTVVDGEVVPYLIGHPKHTEWLKKSVIMHADGGHALASEASAMVMTGTIDDREWTTKCDMMISAVWMEKMRKRNGERVEYIGDTLPNALRDKSDEYLNRLPTMVGPNGEIVPVP